MKKHEAYCRKGSSSIARDIQQQSREWVSDNRDHSTHFNGQYINTRSGAAGQHGWRGLWISTPPLARKKSKIFITLKKKIYKIYKIY